MNELLLLATPWFLEPSNLLAFAVAAFGVGLVIFVHELGHFLVAKACGVKCEKFYIGFDPPISIGPLKLPRTLCKFQWGETEYGVGIIPLGGYVKMLGQDDNPANAAAEAERTRIRKTQENETADGQTAEADAAVESDSGEEDFKLDPRSYPAKSVPQRMAIISAGVTMNVITAVIFAALAYGIGVRYTPTIVGGVVPGAPAWTAGLREGDRIVRIGPQRGHAQHMRWQDDLIKSIAFAEVGKPLEVVIERPGEDELVAISVVPEKTPGREIGSIGIIPAFSTRLAPEDATLAGAPAGDATPSFADGDRIVAINGQPVEDGSDWEALDIAHQDESITVTVERPSEDETGTPQRLDIEVAPTPLRDLGIRFEVEPISGIRPGAPADGVLREGDIIRQVNGQPVEDPLLLPHDLRRLAGQEVTLQVERNQELIELQLTPELPTTYRADSLTQSLVSVASLGVVFPLEQTVASVVPGSPAAKAGLAPGDTLTAAQFVPSEENYAREVDRRTYLKEIDLTQPGQDWLTVFERLPLNLPDTQVQLTWQRGSETMDAKLLPTEISGYFNPRRGIVFVEENEVHRATSAGEAVALGFRQAKEDLLEVFTVIRLLATGVLSVKALGGPGTIAMGATMEASEGIARLLLFMTLISVNLAVINFLPIPVLDGGHMIFLLYEGIRGKPVDEKIAFRLTLVGLSFILALMIFVLSLDALRFGKLLMGCFF